MKISDFPDRMRALQILHLYRIVLGRTADDGGWKSYYDSHLSTEEIENKLKESEEGKKKNG